MRQTLLYRELIPDKSEFLELQVKERLNKCGVVVSIYDLWMSQKNKDIFSMSDHHCEGLELVFSILVCNPQWVQKVKILLMW